MDNPSLTISFLGCFVSGSVLEHATTMTGSIKAVNAVTAVARSNYGCTNRRSCGYKQNRIIGVMSKEELARFRKALATDSNGSIRRKIGNTNDGKEVTRKANKLGYNFTYEDWKAAPKLEPKYIWAFITLVVVLTNWGLIESQFSKTNELFQRGNIEEPKRP